MKTQSVKAVILGKKIISDNDKLVFLYCDEFGKLKVIAKGANKILSRTTGHLETLNIVKASLYFGPKNIILSEIQTTGYFEEIRNNFQKLQFAFQIAEISEKTIYEDQPIKNLLPLIETALKALSQSQNENQLQVVTFTYTVKLLDKFGLIPNFHDLENKKNIPEKYLKFLHFTQKQNFTATSKINLSKKETTDIAEILQALLETHSSFSINTLSTPSTFESFSTNFDKESGKL